MHNSDWGVPELDIMHLFFLVSHPHVLYTIINTGTLQVTDVYTPLPSTSTRNNYARPQIIIKCGFYTISSLNFIL